MDEEKRVSEEEVYEIASFERMNEITGRVIKVKLWNEKNEFGLQVVTIIANNNMLQLNVGDVTILKSLLEHIDI